MKKLLISLTILFSLFIGINSVSAEELDSSISPGLANQLEQVRYINTYGMTNEEVIEIMSKYYTELYNDGKTYDESYSNISDYIAHRTWVEENKDSLGNYFLSKNFLNPNLSLDKINIYLNFSYDTQSVTSTVPLGYIGSSFLTILFDSNINYYKWENSKFVHYYYNIQNQDRVDANLNLWAGSNPTKIYYAFYECNFEKEIIVKSEKLRYGRDSYYSDGFNFKGSIYYPNDTLPYTTLTGFNSLKEDKPTLKYKTGFVSSEAYNVLGKVSVEFSETDTNIYKYKKTQFKLQFGSNDFSKEYIPVFSHYKVFGKRSGTWTELSEEQLKFPYGEDKDGNIIYDDRRLFTIDTTYDYSEGMLADASITFEINYSNLVDTSTTDPIYTDWKIEFYFDNTDNGYIYVYDTLDSSTWTDTAKFLEDYIFYYFPPGYRYAFISSEEETASGRIYFPMNHYNNEAVRFRGYNYDYSKNMVMTDLSSGISENDNYYMYFDFDINNNDKKCAVLSRKMGNLNKFYDPDYLNQPFPFLNSYYLVFDSEVSYFYAPIGVKVTFSKGPNDVIIIHTPDGVINSDSNDIYDRNDYDISKNEDNFFKLFHEGFKFFINPIVNIFSVITQFFEILPLGIQYMFYVAFGFIILLIIYKFLL